MNIVGMRARKEKSRGEIVLGLKFQAIKMELVNSFSSLATAKPLKIFEQEGGMIRALL